MKESVCGNCRYWLKKTTNGVCRRHSPSSDTKSMWPKTMVSEWCGEWADGSISPEQADRQKLVRQLALAIVQGSNDKHLAFPADVWAEADRYADCERPFDS